MIIKTLSIIALSVGLSACADMTRTERVTAIGAGTGAVVGGALSGGSALPGEFRRVRITQASDYDLVGELEDDDSTGPELPPAAIGISHRASDGRRVLRTYR